jgi:flavin-dependent dehydrogenase
MHTANRSRHDVVVVGGRVAGSATAMLLARLGHDVVVVDQASFPSDTLSTHSIARSRVVQLRRWGLLEEVLDSGAPAIRQVTFNAAGESVTRTIKHKAGVDFLVAPRRYVLDTILAGAAERAGADVRDGITVTGVRRDGSGRVTGVYGHDHAGAPVELAARWVVGADGLGSRVARWDKAWRRSARRDAQLIPQELPSVPMGRSSDEAAWCSLTGGSPAAYSPRQRRRHPSNGALHHYVGSPPSRCAARSRSALLKGTEVAGYSNPI